MQVEFISGAKFELSGSELRKLKELLGGLFVNNSPNDVEVATLQTHERPIKAIQDLRDFVGKLYDAISDEEF